MRPIHITSVRMRLRALLVLLVFTASFVGCGNDKSLSTQPIDPALPNAPLEVHSPYGWLTLEVFAWRDFQPISPADGKPLIVLGRIINTDSVAIQDSIWITDAYVVFGKEIWRTKPTGESRPPTAPHVIAFALRNGTKWGPGALIDVIVRIEDNTGSSYLLRVKDQTIVKTE